jgi:type IV pilus assembly protein PilY1
MWGNPMAEMMYETARYFSGAGSATTQFTYSPTDANLDDNQIGLPLATWDTPYNSTKLLRQAHHPRDFGHLSLV